MAIVDKKGGKLPAYMGDWSATYNDGHGYMVKNRVTIFGSEVESLIDNNTYVPATRDEQTGVVTFEEHWKVISNGSQAYAAALAATNKMAELEEEWDDQDQRMTQMQATINAKQLEVGAVQTDEVPTENSGNHMTSGDIYQTLKNSTKGFVDNEPTAGSDNLVKSGGIQNELALGAVYDVSAKNPTAGPNNDGKFESLSALLSDANLNTLIPTTVRKGGMSIKFIQSSDNNYIQARLISDSFTTDVTQWQVVDKEPTAGSINLVESDGTYKSIKYEDRRISLLNGMDISKDIKVGWYLSDGTYTGSDGKRIDGINVVAGEIIQYYGSYGGACKGILCFNSAGTIIDMLEKENLGNSYIEYTVPSNAAYIKVCSFNNYLTVKIKDNISDKVRSLYSTSKITRNNGNLTSTTWAFDGSRHQHIVVDVSDMQVERYEMKCNSAQPSHVAFLSSYVPPMSPYVPISFVGTIDNSYIPLPVNGGVKNGNIPSGTKYIVFDCIQSETSCIPQYVLIDGYDVTKEIIANIPQIKKGLETKIADINERYDKIIKENIQLNESSATGNALPIIADGKYPNTQGTFGEYANAVRTDFVKIANNIEIIYEGQYGGNCAMCQFFDAEYNFLSAITRANLTYVEQKVVIPYNAVYARFGSFNEHGEGLKVTFVPKYREKFSNNEQLNCLLKEVYVSGITLFNKTVTVIVYNNWYNTILDKYVVGIAIKVPSIGDFFGTMDFVTEDDADAYISTNPVWLCKHYTTYQVPLDEITAKVDLNYLAKGERVTFENVRIDDFIVKNPEKPNITKEIKPIKRILWLGTSIPNGGYPNFVGKMLGCTVYNESVGESLCRLGWGSDCIAAGDTIDIWGCNVDTHAWNPASNTITALAKSLSATVAEKQYLINNLSHFEQITHNTLNRSVYTDDVIYSFSYQRKILKYIDSSRNDYTPVDLIVFDHGHNDLNPDGVPAWDTISIDSTDKSNYYGAMNFLISQIRRYASNIPICQISHYFGNEDYQHSYMGTPQFAWEAQKKMADYNGIAYFDFYKYTGISTLRRTYTSGYWDQGCIWHDSGLIFQQNQDGTYTTNSYTIAKDFGFDGTWSNGLFTSNATTLPQNVINKNITMEGDSPYYNLKSLEVAMPDALHPSSDMSQYCNKKFGAIIAGWLDKTYCIK